MTSDIPPILIQAAAHLEAQEQDIFFRWVQIASRLPAHFRRPDEDLEQLVDHMPHVLAKLRRLMLKPVDPAMPMDVDETVAISHALTRHRQRISARTVVKEYQLLRRELWSSLRRWPQAAQLSAGDVFLLEERINFVLDELVAITLDTFVCLEIEGGDAEAAEPADNLTG